MWTEKSRKKWKENNLQKMKELKEKWIKNNPKKYKEQKRRSHWNIKVKTLKHYGGENPKCACCGEKEIKFLTIDHINNNGAKHRKELKKSGYNFYYWLKRNKYPSEYQVLCFNCNIAKGLYGKCPHNKKILNPVKTGT